MRRSSRILLPLVVLAGLVMPGTAHAAGEPMPQAEWEAAAGAAIDASGVFAAGTTFSMLQETKDTVDSTTVMVRTDGSLHGQRTTSSGTTRIRCVRVDRCWTQSQVTFGDARWHRVPAGTVTYVDARAYWWGTVMGLPAAEGTLFTTGPADDGTMLYISVNSTQPAVEVTGTGAKPNDLATVRMTLIDGTPTTMHGAAAETVADAAPVRAPARRSIGAPATTSDPWTAPINPAG